MKKFAKGFVYAFRGLMTCLREERNFRFHLVVAFHLFVYLPFFTLSRGETALLTAICGGVISLEAVNSAIERAVNVTGVISPTAGAAKDIAAGAVLAAALTAVAVGVMILWQPHAFAMMARFFLHRPIWIAVQLAVLAVSGWFVFLWRAKP